MNRDYELMLIFPPGRLGEVSRQFLENNAPTVNQLQRPKVGLGYVDEKPVLQFATGDDPGIFLKALDHEKEEKRPLTLLSSLPSADLSKLHTSSFYLEGRFLRLTWKNRMLRDSPYNRRLLDVVEIEAKDINDKPPDAQIGLGYLSVPPLFVDPQFIPVLREEAGAWWQAGLFARLDFGVLPPYRGTSSTEIEYFKKELAGTREAITALLECYLDTSKLPTVLHLLRLADDPLYQDILADGGTIRIGDENRRPTSVQLGINPGKSDSICQWRSGLLTHGGEGLGQPWLAEIYQAIRDDCLNPSLGFSLTMFQEREGVHWTIKHPELTDELRSTNPSGVLCSWLRFLADALPSGQRELFNRLVLTPSNDPYAGPNDAYASELFEHYFWRQPYSLSVNRSECREVWGEVWRKLVQHFASSRRLDYGEMFSRKNERGLPRVQEGSIVRVTHPSDEKPWNRLRWRLLLPLSSVLERIATNVLDSPDTILDEDLVLGGGTQL